MNMIQALNSAMDIMLGKDPSVMLMGEDIGWNRMGGSGGLLEKFGKSMPQIHAPVPGFGSGSRASLPFHACRPRGELSLRPC